MDSSTPDTEGTGVLARLAAFDSCPVLTTVFEGPDLVVRALNSTSRDWFGERDVVGRPGREAIPEFVSHQLWTEIERVRRTGITFTGTNKTLRVEAPGGTPQETVVDLVLEPWCDADGSVRGVVCYGIDLTALTQALRAERSHADDLLDRYEQAQDLVSAFQDALLPAELPLLPTLCVGARYLVAEAENRAGGDWFDAVPRADGRLALVVGDVIGHGVGATAVMGRLQAVLRERLSSGADLAEAVTCLDRFATGTPEASGATVGIVEIDPDSDVVRYVLAGHPPPLVVDHSGGFRFLEPLGGRPLVTGGSYTEGEGRLGPDELLVLYTDGLVERPDRGAAHSTVELARVAARAYAQSGDGRGRNTADDVSTSIVQDLVQATGYADDVTLVVASRCDKPRQFASTVPAVTTSVPTVRGALGDWLSTIGTRLVDRMAVLHAADEAMANVVRHAYADREPGSPSGDLEVSARLSDDGTLNVEVADRGTWREQATAGRGLTVAGALVDRLEIRRADEGTTVALRHRLSREAELLEPVKRTEADGVPARAATSIEADVDRVRVHGPLDSRSAERLRGALLGASRAGSRDATLDLTDVSQLTGAAVDVLFEALGRSELHARELTVLAPPGTPAQHVLEVVSLPYTIGSDDPRSS